MWCEARQYPLIQVNQCSNRATHQIEAWSGYADGERKMRLVFYMCDYHTQEAQQEAYQLVVANLASDTYIIGRNDGN